MRPLFKRPRTQPAAQPTRDTWHRYITVNGAFTCCGHCPTPCPWHNWHPGPCRQCIRELENSRRLLDCLTGSDGRCVTCEALHGVRITHRGRP